MYIYIVYKAYTINSYYKTLLQKHPHKLKYGGQLPLVVSVCVLASGDVRVMNFLAAVVLSDQCPSSSLGQATEALRHVRRSLYLRMQVEELDERK